MVKRIACLVSAFLLAAAAFGVLVRGPASAQTGDDPRVRAEPQFPRNGLVGLVPPPGMVAAQYGADFDAGDRSLYAYIRVDAEPAQDALTPAQAFARFESSYLSEETLASTGRRVVLREHLSPTRLLVATTQMTTLARGTPEERTVEIETTWLLFREAGLTGSAMASIERAAAHLFPRERIRESLASVVLRAPIPRDRKLAAIRNIPPEAPFMAPRAVDHFVAMTSESGEEIVVARSGAWQREDRLSHGFRTTVYSNVATGVSVRIDYERNGRVRTLHAYRLGPDGLDHAFENFGYRRTRTRERDTALGETCSIWRAELDDPPPRDREIVEGCTTRDGVDLWRRMIMPEGDLHGYHSVRATSVERRPVSVAEAHPPRELLDATAWRDGPAEAGETPNNEVRLDGMDEAAGLYGEMIIRRRAGWTYRSTVGRVISLEYDFGGPFYSYAISSDGRLSHLFISRSDRPNASLNRSETVLGETCTWFGADLRNAECRTRDGAILAVRHSAAEHTAHWTATSVRRGGVAGADMQPPPEAAAWFW